MSKKTEIHASLAASNEAVIQLEALVEQLQQHFETQHGHIRPNTTGTEQSGYRREPDELVETNGTICLDDFVSHVRTMESSSYFLGGEPDKEKYSNLQLQVHLLQQQLNVLNDELRHSRNLQSQSVFCKQLREEQQRRADLETQVLAEQQRRADLETQIIRRDNDLRAARQELEAALQELALFKRLLEGRCSTERLELLPHAPAVRSPRTGQPPDVPHTRDPTSPPPPSERGPAPASDHVDRDAHQHSMKVQVLEEELHAVLGAVARSQHALVCDLASCIRLVHDLADGDEGVSLSGCPSRDDGPVYVAVSPGQQGRLLSPRHCAAAAKGLRLSATGTWYDGGTIHAWMRPPSDSWSCTDSELATDDGCGALPPSPPSLPADIQLTARRFTADWAGHSLDSRSPTSSTPRSSSGTPGAAGPPARACHLFDMRSPTCSSPARRPNRTPTQAAADAPRWPSPTALPSPTAWPGPKALAPPHGAADPPLHWPSPTERVEPGSGCLPAAVVVSVGPRAGGACL